jgi:hypothetical protein
MIALGLLSSEACDATCSALELRGARGVDVVVFEIIHDGLLQFQYVFEDAAADSLSGGLGEETLDHVEPRAGDRRHEVRVEVQMPLGLRSTAEVLWLA